MASNNTLRITEIFQSLQGESTLVGLPTTFVRLTGCPLRCLYCDTSYAFKGGQLLAISDIVAKVAQNYASHVCITGGEPLAQPNCHELLTTLCDLNYTVSLETSGAISIAKVDPRVIKVIDLKTPDSGEVSKNLFSNIELLQPTDQIKFVVCSFNDFIWARDIVNEHKLREKCEILFSPSYNQVAPIELAQWILDHKLLVRMQLQLHKTIWGEAQGV